MLIPRFIKILNQNQSYLLETEHLYLGYFNRDDPTEPKYNPKRGFHACFMMLYSKFQLNW